jgi:hypothetical protein
MRALTGRNLVTVRNNHAANVITKFSFIPRSAKCQVTDEAITAQYQRYCNVLRGQGYPTPRWAAIGECGTMMESSAEERRRNWGPALAPLLQTAISHEPKSRRWEVTASAPELWYGNKCGYCEKKHPKSETVRSTFNNFVFLNRKSITMSGKKLQRTTAEHVDVCMNMVTS